MSLGEGYEDAPVCFWTLAYVLQEACESLHVRKGEGAYVHVGPCVTCESGQHAGACA